LPAIVEADDDGLYVLKFRGAGQGPKALIAELVAGDEGEGSRIIHHVRVLIRVQADVHRDHGHSRLNRGENRLEPLRAVGYEQGHAVAGLPAEAEERLCEAADSCRRLAKRHDPSRIHPGWAVRVSLSGAWEEAARIHSRLVQYSQSNWRSTGWSA